MNKQTKKAIKRKIRPLMPESAYLYFLKWFDLLPEIKEGTRFTVWCRACNYPYEVVLAEDFMLDKEEIAKRMWLEYKEFLKKHYPKGQDFPDWLTARKNESNTR